MTSEMISGPDLGGGFLHQLSLDRDGDRTTFTFHAQDGGSDAGGPPRGPLDVFGFVHPPAACMFGGPGCWHRRFLLPFVEVPRVRQAYNRQRFVLETMMAQAYDAVPAAVESGLQELLRRLSALSLDEKIDWYLGGSGAVWLQGANVTPRDLDVGTTRTGVDRVAGALSEFLIEPLATTDWPGRGIVRGARAFVGTLREGVRVEWAVPLEPRPTAELEEWSGIAGVARCREVRFGEHTVRVTRPEYALVRAAERGHSDQVSTLAPLVRQLGPDERLLRVLLNRSHLPAAGRDRLLAASGM